MVEILGKLVEAEILADALHAPGLGHRLEGAEQDLARVLLVVGAFLGDPEHREPLEAGDRLGDDVEVLAGVERQGHAVPRGEITAPHAAAVHHQVGGDVALGLARLPVDAGDAPVGAGHRRHLHLLDDARAPRPRALGERQRDIARVRLSIRRQMHAGHDAFDVETRVHRRDLGGGELVHLDIEGARHGGETQNLLAPLGAQRHGDRPALAEAGGKAGLRLQSPVEIGRVFCEPGPVLARLQLPDEPGRVPGGAGGELLALQQHHVCPAERGQVVGDGAAGDAAADDDDTGGGGQVDHARSLGETVDDPGSIALTVVKKSIIISLLAAWLMSYSRFPLTGAGLCATLLCPRADIDDDGAAWRRHQSVAKVEGKHPSGAFRKGRAVGRMAQPG